MRGLQKSTRVGRRDDAGRDFYWRHIAGTPASRVKMRRRSSLLDLVGMFVMVVVFLAVMVGWIFAMFLLPARAPTWVVVASIVFAIAFAIVCAWLAGRFFGVALGEDGLRLRWAARVLRAGACPACGRAIGADDLLMDGSQSTPAGVGMCPGCGTAWRADRLGERMEPVAGEVAMAEAVFDGGGSVVTAGEGEGAEGQLANHVLFSSAWVHDDAGRAVALFPEWLCRAYSFEPALAACDWMSPDEDDFDAVRRIFIARERAWMRWSLAGTVIGSGVAITFLGALLIARLNPGSHFGVPRLLATLLWICVCWGVAIGIGDWLAERRDRRVPSAVATLVRARRCASCGAVLDERGVCSRSACGADWSAGGKGEVVPIGETDDAGRPIRWWRRAGRFGLVGHGWQLLTGVSLIVCAPLGVWLVMTLNAAHGVAGVWQVELLRYGSFIAAWYFVWVAAGRAWVLRDDVDPVRAGGELLSGMCPACGHGFLDGPVVLGETGVVGVGACPRCSACWDVRRVRRVPMDTRWHEVHEWVLTRSSLWEQRVFGVPGVFEGEPDAAHLEKVREAWVAVCEREGPPKEQWVRLRVFVAWFLLMTGVMWVPGVAAWSTMNGLLWGLVVPGAGLLVLMVVTVRVLGWRKALRVRRAVVEERMSRGVCPVCAGVLGGGGSERRACWSCGTAWDTVSGRVILD